MPTPPTLEELKESHERLHEQFATLARRDPLVAEATSDGGDVMVAISARFMEDVIQKVTRTYLNRVMLDLKGFEAKADGALTTKTFLGDVKLGYWTVSIDVERLRGTLRSHTPTVRFAEANALAVSLPVLLESGTGTATFHFRWNSKGLASVICKSFTLSRELSGRVLPDEYALAGSFVLKESDNFLSAEPVFPNRKILLHLDLSPQSWDQVERAFATQETLLKCGILLNPKDAVKRLRDLGASGIEIKLPDVMFRTVRWPAGFARSISIKDKVVGLQVRARRVRVTPRVIWWSASVKGEPGESGGGN